MAQFLTDNLLLAGIGAVAGLLLALAGTKALVTLSPAYIPHVEMVAIDGWAVLFLMGVTVLTALIFGLASALQAAAGSSSLCPACIRWEALIICRSRGICGTEDLIEGHPKPRPGEMPNAVYRIVMPGFRDHAPAGEPRARHHVSGPCESQAVIIINDRAAERFWPRENPIGKRIAIGGRVSS